MDDDNVIPLRGRNDTETTIGQLARDPEKYPVLVEVRGLLDEAADDIATQLRTKERDGDFKSSEDALRFYMAALAEATWHALAVIAVRIDEQRQ